MAKTEAYAIRGYFFGKNYRDLGATIRGSFGNTVEAIKETAECIKESVEHGWFLVPGLFIQYILILIFRVIFGFAFTIFFSVFHIVAITIFMMFFYVVFMVTWFIDKTYRTFKKISNNCSACQRKFDFPVYHCPDCGAPHRFLFPSSYGTFHHRCTCGRKLPTIYVNGRHRLLSTCPHCGSPVISGMHSAVIFPVFGGTNSGKTCFINMALEELEGRAESLGCRYEYFYGVLGDEREANRQRMAQGIAPDATSDRSLRLYNFYFSPIKSRVKNYISLCDVAGEVFQHRDEIERQAGYHYADEVVFVIDPLSLVDFRDYLNSNGFDVARFKFSTHDISDIISAMVTSLEAIYHKKDPKLGLTVVFTKGDVPELDGLIGETAIEKYLAKNGGKRRDACNALAEKFLVRFGQANALNQMKNRFTSIQFFTVSALGKDQEKGKAFQSEHASDPLLWLIDRHYANLNFDKELWRK